MAPSSNVLTYGIVGVGLMGMEHIRNILCLDDTAITCIADDFAASRHSCMKFLGEQPSTTVKDVQAFETAEELFRAKLCDIAIIATPNHTHHDVLVDAYTHSATHMHVVVEKPLCTTIADCRHVVTLAAKRAGLTFVGLEYCYMPPVTRVMRDARRGVIGAPQMVSIREHRFPFLPKVRNWNRFSKNSGGTFVEKCCHFFDLFSRILAPHVPVSVYASGAQDVNHLDEVYDGQKADILDNGYVVLNYSNGRRACLDLCMFAEASHSQEEVCITGPKGKLEAFLPQMEVRTGIRGQHACGNVTIELVNDDRIRYAGHHHGSSFLEHMDVLETLRTKRSSKAESIRTAGCEQALLATAIGIAAHMSIDEKRVVEMGELLTEKELQAYVYMDGME